MNGNELTEPSAKVILDSISPEGTRLTTLEVTFHRFILSEFNTHRVFSRNSASSRAIPVSKQVEKIVHDPALPHCYKYNQSGMQAAELMSEDDAATAEEIIMNLRLEVAAAVEDLNRLGGKGLHKQWANRYLEPWMWHTVIVTATDWKGFWNQRVSELAQPEIDAAARAMLIAFTGSTPKFLDVGEWHTPYIQPEEYDEFSLEDRKQVSAARCARVSYLTQDGVRDVEKDFELYSRLVTANPAHYSPLEHVATPVTESLNPLGNFEGWAQLRHNH